MNTSVIWVIAIIVLIIVVVIIIAVAMDSSETPPNNPTIVKYGEKCVVTGTSLKCDTNLTCVANTGASEGICRKNSGQPCTTNLECSPNTCIDGICSSKGPIPPTTVNDIIVAGFGAPPDFNTVPIVTVTSLIYNSNKKEFDYINLSNNTQFFLPDVSSENGGKQIAQIPKDDSNDNYKFFFNVPGNQSSSNPVPNYTIGVFDINFQPTIIEGVNTPVSINDINFHNINLNSYLDLLINTDKYYAWGSFFNSALLTSKWGTPNVPFVVSSFIYNKSQQEFDVINCVRSAYTGSSTELFSFYLPKIESLGNGNNLVSQIPKDNSNPRYNFFFNNLSGDITSSNPVIAYTNEIFITNYNFTAVNIPNRNYQIQIVSLTFYNRTRDEYLTLNILTNNTNHTPYIASWADFYPTSTLDI